MLEYMLYLVTFVIGAILGLLYSYKQHSEPYVALGNLDVVNIVLVVVGLLLVAISGNMILAAVGCFIVGFFLCQRPGYGRREFVIGAVIALVIYLLLKSGSVVW